MEGQMVGILDYGIGNIGSIKNMLSKIGEKNTIFLEKPDDFDKIDKIILPGVGSFDKGMHLLDESGMRAKLDEQVLKLHKPVLGICLGMQMLGMQSEEGKEKGLGYIDFSCRKFHFEDNRLKVPHMGWDYVDVLEDEPLVRNLGEKPRFYFVHSYYAICQNPEDVLLTCDYGHDFVAAVHHNNIYGTQFHPEKSHAFGMRLFENFIKEI